MSLLNKQAYKNMVTWFISACMNMKNRTIISILLFFMVAQVHAVLPPNDLELENGECPSIKLKIVAKTMEPLKAKKGHSYFDLTVSSRHIGLVNGKIKEIRLVDSFNKPVRYTDTERSLILKPFLGYLAMKNVGKPWALL